MSTKKLTDIKRITAEPTKELFITMLVKDITLRDAIGDLVDNSVDAAKDIASNPNDLTGFEIHILLEKNHFGIKDNCSGLEAKDARSNAFYFGKPKDYKPGKHTIGQFGIGMKRAFFKIGNFIKVQSIAQFSSFDMHIDVSNWRKDSSWDFQFDIVKENIKNDLSKTGLDINITNLHPDAQDKFTDKQFINELKNEIALEHLYPINQGLSIYINGELLRAQKLKLIFDKKRGVEPAYWKHKFKNGLIAEIITGVSEDIGSEGGWYVFCNDRLILGPDTTEITGWSGSGAREMPRYHDQFYRFRGFVFFNADDSALLPWNTSKTSMDLDSPDWLFVRNQMIIMGKQVKKLMDDMKKEREKGNPENNQLLNNTIKESDLKTVSEILNFKSSLPQIYKYPDNLLSVAPKGKKGGVKITFYKPESVVKATMNYFGVSDSDAAGEKAFNYFYENEIGE